MSARPNSAQAAEEAAQPLDIAVPGIVEDVDALAPRDDYGALLLGVEDAGDRQVEVAVVVRAR